MMNAVPASITRSAESPAILGEASIRTFPLASATRAIRYGVTSNPPLANTE